MLAAASAGVRGVAVAEVCPVYGVRTVGGAQPADGTAPGRPLPVEHAARLAHAGHHERAGHAGYLGHAEGHGEHATDAASNASDATHATLLVTAPAGHDPTGDHGPAHEAAGKLHDAGHCALGALPLSAGAPSHGLPPPAGGLADTGVAAASQAAAGSDATARWVARLKHGPPAAA